MGRKMQRGKRINYNEILRNPTKPKNDIKDNKNENLKVNESYSKINKEVSEVSHDKQYANKKYIQYEIRVTYLNGEVKNLDLKKEKIDTSKLKKVIAYYNIFKKKCINEMIDKIEFIGVPNKGKKVVMFTKDIKYTENTDNPYKNMEILDLIKEMQLIIQAVQSKEPNGIKKVLPALEKKQDVILHQIENFGLIKYNSRYEQNKLFNRLQQVRNERRKVKNDIQIIEHFNRQINLSDIEDQIDVVLRLYKKKGKVKRYLSDNMVEEMKMLKEIPYKTIEQSDFIQQQVKNDYNRIINDKFNHKLYCYNNAKQTW